VEWESLGSDEMGERGLESEEEMAETERGGVIFISPTSVIFRRSPRWAPIRIGTDAAHRKLGPMIGVWFHDRRVSKPSSRDIAEEPLGRAYRGHASHNLHVELSQKNVRVVDAPREEECQEILRSQVQK